MRTRESAAAATVLYVGVEDESYPRNQRIRAYLEQRGARVAIIASPVRKGRLRRAMFLAAQFLPHTRGYTHVVLAEFSNSLFWYSRLLALTNRAPHIVDFFIGKYETLVEDGRRYDPASLAARVLRFIDVATLKSADVVVTDTVVRAASFARLTKTRARFFALPVGSPFHGRAVPVMSETRTKPNFLYYGFYSRLHGVPEITRALIAASSSADFTVTLVGDGDTRAEVETIVREAGASRFEFIDSMPADELERRIEASDVVFGAFGTSTKARTVIPNKVWQGLYAGKTVITGESEALGEIAALVGDQLVAVPLADAEALRSAVSRVAVMLASDEAPDHGGAADILEDYVRARFDDAFDRILGPRGDTEERRTV